MTTNPKLTGSNILDCRIQTGDCPRACNQCFYNHMPDDYKASPIIPSVQEAKGKIVRMNAEHDSGVKKNLVIEAALLYDDSFFNTSLPDTNYPRPVVLTVNPDERVAARHRWTRPKDVALSTLMFVRFRVSAENYLQCTAFEQEWLAADIPVVLTFMRYYTKYACPSLNAYEFKQHFLHDCWQLKEEAKEDICQYAMIDLMSGIYTCGETCATCGNCERFYWIAKDRMVKLGTWS